MGESPRGEDHEKWNRASRGASIVKSRSSPREEHSSIVHGDFEDIVRTFQFPLNQGSLRTMHGGYWAVEVAFQFPLNQGSLRTGAWNREEARRIVSIPAESGVTSNS